MSISLRSDILLCNMIYVHIYMCVCVCVCVCVIYLVNLDVGIILCKALVTYDSFHFINSYSLLLSPIALTI